VFHTILSVVYRHIHKSINVKELESSIHAMRRKKVGFVSDTLNSRIGTPSDIATEYVASHSNALPWLDNFLQCPFEAGKTTPGLTK